MQEYVRYKPFNKGLFDDAVNGPHRHIRPITEKQRIEADLVGLDVICSSTYPNKNLYKYRDCGHLEYLQPTHVRRNNFRCDTCQHTKEVAEANNSDILLLFKTKCNYRLYLRPCGHLFEGTVQTVKKAKGYCHQCFEESMLAVAGDNGYEVIGYSGAGRRTIRFKDCGHEKELRQDHAQDGVWLCSHCGDSHYNKPSNVYIIKFTHQGFSWLKFGFAKHVSLRANGYGVPSRHCQRTTGHCTFQVRVRSYAI